MDSRVLDVLYKWRHATCGLSCLASSAWFSGSFVYIVARISASFLLMTERKSSRWMCHISLTHLSVGGHVGGLHFYSFMSDHHKHLCGYIIYFQSSWDGSSVLNILGNCQTVFQSGYSILQSHQQMWAFEHGSKNPLFMTSTRQHSSISPHRSR